MPSLKDIRKRISTVKNTQQITRAMKMVAAAKLRRAQEAILKARPYAELLERTIQQVAARAEPGTDAGKYPLLTTRPAKRVELVLLTSDRGLAGAFNSNIVRRTGRYLYENERTHEQIRISTMGRKARDHFKRTKGLLRADFPGAIEHASFASARDIAQSLAEEFLSGRVDRVVLVYNEFRSAISQNVVLHQILPIETSPAEGKAAPTPTATVDFIYEPSREALMTELLPKHIAMQVYRAMLESAASEHGARMTAMESATKNASEMIDKLKLQFNRARQAYITKELMEIVSGSEALK